MASKPPINLATDRDPWERQPGESQKQYARFLAFLELGRLRTLKQAMEILQGIGDTAVGYRTLQQYAYELQWTPRAEAKDRSLDALERARLIQLRDEMFARHRKLASGLMAKGVAALQALQPGDLTALDIVRFFKYGSDLEVRALGEPTTIAQVQGPGGGPIMVDDMAHLSPGDRAARLAAISAELARRAAASVTTDDDD